MRTSVIIPAYQAWATLPEVLDALEPQIDDSREAILVESSGDGRSRELDRWPWLRTIVLSERTLPGRARNIGRGAARGSRLAFLDADAVPQRCWLSRLEAGLAPDIDAVCGAVLNGTPRNQIGTAGYLLEFSEWLPYRHAAGRGATCNLLVRTEAFDRAGGFTEDLWPGEDTVLTFGWGQTGRLAFAPDAAVHHRSRTGLAEFLRHQHRLGMSYARVCAEVEFPHRGLNRPLLLPLTVPLRGLALMARLVRTPRLGAAAIPLLPLLTAGLVAWAIGVGRRPLARR